MNEGFIYIIKRNKSDLKILARANIKEFAKNPNPFELIEDKLIAKGVFNTIKENKLEWESFAENGTIEQILEKYKLKGINFKTGKYSPLIQPKNDFVQISKTYKFERKI